MKVGILGGGQLARMLILAGTPLGCEFLIYAAQKTASTESLAPTICGDFTPSAALDQFIAECDVVTFENENIPTELAKLIEKQKKLYPGSQVLQYAQDRVFEKKCFTQLQIPTNQFLKIDCFTDLQHACHHLGYPFIVKSRREGYDGKHQKVIKTEADIREFAKKEEMDSIAEEFIHFNREISMIGVRSTQGDIVFYDVCENQHRDGILIKTANKPDDLLADKAQQYVASILKHFNYIGTLAVEFFVQGNKLLANEMAPRVHNSGHWTIEGANISQFENHIRAICGLPLGDTTSLGYSMMLNCIGQMPSLQQALTVADLHYHDYVKSPRAGRKLGHITFVKQAQQELLDIPASAAIPSLRA